jgi:hypothetical protein
MPHLNNELDQEILVARAGCDRVELGLCGRQHSRYLLLLGTQLFQTRSIQLIGVDAVAGWEPWISDRNRKQKQKKKQLAARSLKQRHTALQSVLLTPHCVLLQVVSARTFSW